MASSSTQTRTGRSGLRLSERISLALFALIAAAAGIGFGVSAVFGILDAMVGDTVHTVLSAQEAVPAGAATGSATLVSGEFDSATVVISGLDLASRSLLAGGILVTALMYLTLAAAIVFICVNLMRGRPFSRSSTWWLATASLLLIGGGLVGAGLFTFGQLMIAAQLNADPTMSVFPMAGTISLTPVFVGVGIAVIAAVFEFGERLQRETEGLV